MKSCAEAHFYLEKWREEPRRKRRRPAVLELCRRWSFVVRLARMIDEEIAALSRVDCFSSTG